MSFSDNLRLMILLGVLGIVRSKGNEDISRNKHHAACPLLYFESSQYHTCHIRRFLLQCQISGDGLSHLSVKWHYSSSQPNISNTGGADYINSFTTNIHHNISSSTTYLVSQLNVTDVKRDGYYWCSVHSSNTAHIALSNLTIVLHVMYQLVVECLTNRNCDKQAIVTVHKNYTTAQCAGQAVSSVNVTDPKDCTPTSTTAAVGETTTSAEVHIDLPTTAGQTATLKTAPQQTKAMQQTTTTVTSVDTSALSLSTGIVIGASMGGLILILCLIIGFLAVCVMRMKMKHRTREHRTDPTSPFDDIRMYSSVTKVGMDETDGTNRASKMLCDSNISYECSRVTVSQPTDNIYDYIY